MNHDDVQAGSGTQSIDVTTGNRNKLFLLKMTLTWSRFADIFYTNGDLLKFDLEAVCKAEQFGAL